MKKFFKLGKRMLALFIVVLLNINSYAAVGANDGSAFVTKAEFDALVNTFNEQMDTYQSGLNSKIDGAIANYLAGLSSVQVIELDNLATKYCQSLGISVISPRKDVTADGAFTATLMNILTYSWMWVQPANGSESLPTVQNAKASGAWQYFNESNKQKGTKNSTYPNSFFVKDENGYVNMMITNCNSSVSCGQVLVSSPGYGSNISIKNSTWTTAAVNKHKTDSALTGSATYNYSWTGTAWQTTTGGAQPYSIPVSFGAYIYSGSKNLANVSQIVNFSTTSVPVIEYNDYENNTMFMENHGFNMGFMVGDPRTTATAPPRTPAKYGRIKSTSTNVTNVKSAGHYGAGFDNVGMYAGIPLCKATEDGTINFIITLTNDDLGDICISDNNTGFSNTASPEPGINFAVDDRAYSNRWTTNNGDSGDHTIKFDCIKNKTYWIKWIPNSNGPAYKIGDKITQSSSN